MNTQQEGMQADDPPRVRVRFVGGAAHRQVATLAIAPRMVAVGEERYEFARNDGDVAEYRYVAPDA